MWFRIGWILIGASGVFFGGLFVIPFLPIGTAPKWYLGAATYIAMQVSWWIGAICVGPEAVRALKRRLFGWRK